MYYILGWQDGSMGQDTVVRPCSHPSTYTKLTHTCKKKLSIESSSHGTVSGPVEQGNQLTSCVQGIAGLSCE